MSHEGFNGKDPKDLKNQYSDEIYRFSCDAAHMRRQAKAIALTYHGTSIRVGIYRQLRRRYGVDK
jgi:hypothetical protein